MPEFLRRWVVALLKIPASPGSAPAPARARASESAGERERVLVFRAAPGYARYRLWLWALGQLFALLGAAAVGMFLLVVSIAIVSQSAPGPAFGKKHHGLLEQVSPAVLPTIVGSIAAVVLVVMLAQSLFAYALTRLDFEQRWYTVTDRGLRIREGVWTVREMTMSFANIQNLSITQGPLQKLCGVADLVVESAGGGPAKPGEPNLHVGAFRGIDNAEELKAMMLARLRALKGDGGLGHHEEPDARREAVARTTDMRVAVSPSTPMLAALREVRDEARRLREATVAPRS
jgi:membrane protein YdbS with pleckstrin-like domain